MLSKRHRKMNVCVQELVQSLQGAFDSSRCVHVVSALCRIRERCCGINFAASSFPFCAGTWEEEEESVFVFFGGVEGGGVVAVWWESLWWISDSCSPQTSYKINLFFFFLLPYHPFITSLSSLGFPGKNIAWSLLFTWLHVWNCNFNVSFSKPFVHEIIPWMAAL